MTGEMILELLIYTVYYAFNRLDVLEKNYSINIQGLAAMVGRGVGEG